MRTTITFEPDVAKLVSSLMKKNNWKLKSAINELIRRGAHYYMKEDKSIKVPEPVSMEALIDYTNTWEILEEIEGA